MSEKKQTHGATVQSPWVFLGFDLRQIGTLWLEGWAEALRFPWLSWLKPKDELLVYSPDGRVQRYEDGQWRSTQATDRADFHAILLPEEILLRRVLNVPRLSSVELMQLLAYEIEGASPFGVAQTVWGYRVVKETAHDPEIELLLTSRAQIDRIIGHLASDLPSSESEIWGLGSNQRPVVFIGMGAERRSRHFQRQLKQRAALLLLLPVLLVLLFAPPVLEARKTVQQAEQAYQTLQHKAGALEQKRNLMQTQKQSLDDVTTFAQGQPQVLEVLNLLSDKIPDSASLNRFSINPQRVAISGQADNAAALMQVLGGVPGIMNVRAPSAITRMAGLSQELFALEFNVDLGGKP